MMLKTIFKSCQLTKQAHFTLVKGFTIRKLIWGLIRRPSQLFPAHACLETALSEQHSPTIVSHDYSVISLALNNIQSEICKVKFYRNTTFNIMLEDEGTQFQV